MFACRCCPCRGTDDRYFIKAMIRMWKCLAVARTAKCIMLLINVALSSNVFLSLRCLSHCYPALCLRPFIFVLPSRTRFHFSLGRRGNDPSLGLVLAQTHRLASDIKLFCFWMRGSLQVSKTQLGKATETRIHTHTHTCTHSHTHTCTHSHTHIARTHTRT